MLKNQIIFPDYNNSILNFSCSILNHFGAKVHHNTLPQVDKILEKNYKNVVVILLDGLGINILEKHLKPNDFLRKHFLCEYSSVFPPTTTASTTTMMSGLSPIEHGWLGWDVYFEQEDKIVTCFKNTLAGTTTPAAEYNIAYKYLPYKNLEQIINQTQNADAKILFPWIIEKPFDLDCWINEIQNHCNKNQRTFTYAYWEQPDGFLHAEGSDSQNVHNIIEELNKKIESLCADLTDTVVFITADHGHIDIQMDYFEENYPDFAKMLVRPVSIEQRGISFYVKDEFIPVFKERFLKLFGSDYLIFSKEEVFQNKLFGSGVPNKNLTGIGDFIAPAIGTRTMFWNKKFPQFKSHHAGLTSQEMKIPLIVVEK